MGELSPGNLMVDFTATGPPASIFLDFPGLTPLRFFLQGKGVRCRGTNHMGSHYLTIQHDRGAKPG
jgi:hypothetical protein